MITRKRILLALAVSLSSTSVFASTGQSFARPIALPAASSPAAMVPQAPGPSKIALAMGRPVKGDIFYTDGEEIGVVLQALSAAAGVMIVPDPDVTGKVKLMLSGETLAQTLSSICLPMGYYFTEEDGYISVRSKRFVLYSVNYPQLSRSNSSSAAITVNAGSSRGGSDSMNGGILQRTSALAGGVGNGQNGTGSGSDATQFSLQAENEANMWATLDSRLKAMVGEDESVVVDPFSGIISVDARSRTHNNIRRFLDELNERVGTRIDVIVRILEVQTNNERKLGIDWQAVQFSIGDLNVGSSVTSPSTGRQLSGITGATNMTGAGQFTFSPDTLTGAVSLGKVTAVIQALQQQGDVRQVSQPRLSTLNNQTAYIKDGIDKAFFSLSSRVTINDNGTGIGGAQPVTERQYDKEFYAIGTALAVTPSVEGDIVTMDVSPVITRLLGTETSPDNTQTAPTLSTKQTGAIARVRSGETAIIGGLQTESTANAESAVPGLSRIPVLGRAFKSEGTIKQSSELVIFLTPTVVRYERRSSVLSDPLQINVAASAGPRVEGIEF